MGNYRVTDKQNIFCHGKKTLFKIYERGNSAFVYAGQFMAKGWDAADEDCISVVDNEMEWSNEN